MTNIILCGCNGKMGAAVQNFVNQREDCSIVAGVDVSGGGNGSFPVYTSLADVEEEAWWWWTSPTPLPSPPFWSTAAATLAQRRCCAPPATAQSRPRRFKRQAKELPAFLFPQYVFGGKPAY